MEKCEVQKRQRQRIIHIALMLSELNTKIKDFGTLMYQSLFYFFYTLHFPSSCYHIFMYLSSSFRKNNFRKVLRKVLTNDRYFDIV